MPEERVANSGLQRKFPLGICSVITVQKSAGGRWISYVLGPPVSLKSKQYGLGGAGSTDAGTVGQTSPVAVAVGVAVGVTPGVGVAVGAATVGVIPGAGVAVGTAVGGCVGTTLIAPVVGTLVGVEPGVEPGVTVAVVPAVAVAVVPVVVVVVPVAEGAVAVNPVEGFCAIGLVGLLPRMLAPTSAMTSRTDIQVISPICTPRSKSLNQPKVPFDLLGGRAPVLAERS